MKHGKEYVPLSIVSFNARCLHNKFAQFRICLHENSPDVVVVTETWFSKDILDNEYLPEGYIAFRKDRHLNYYTQGTYQREDRSGVLVLVKGNLNPITFDTETEAEILWVEINPTPDMKWLIGGCYRPGED